jgi:hypothetical protein
MNETTRTQPECPSSRDDGEKGGVRLLTGQLFRVRDGRGWSFTEQPPPAPLEPVRRPARVAQVLALAHRLQAAIDRGEYRDRAELARQLGFTRARVTQILDLLLLAPDIQEHVVHLEAVDGVEPIAERALRDVVRQKSWAKQRRAWDVLCLQDGQGSGAT